MQPVGYINESTNTVSSTHYSNTVHAGGIGVGYGTAASRSKRQALRRVALNISSCYSIACLLYKPVHNTAEPQINADAHTVCVYLHRGPAMPDGNTRAVTSILAVCAAVLGWRGT
jgi:hypothetical protein